MTQLTGEARMKAALAPFGWTCTEEFWKRYYNDAWVFNLANAVERLSQLSKTTDGAMKISVTLEDTHPAEALVDLVRQLQEQLDIEQLGPILDRALESIAVRVREHGIEIVYVDEPILAVTP